MKLDNVMGGFADSLDDMEHLACARPAPDSPARVPAGEPAAIGEGD